MKSDSNSKKNVEPAARWPNGYYQNFWKIQDRLGPKKNWKSRTWADHGRQNLKKSRNGQDQDQDKYEILGSNSGGIGPS